MPICRSCSGTFPNKIKIEDKIYTINHRKFCLACSPFKERKGQLLAGKLGLERKNSRLGKEYLLSPVVCTCFMCGRVYDYYTDSPQGHTLKTCNSCSTHKRRTTIKERAVTYKGGSCKKCGYSACLKALVFHHVDPKSKLFAVGGNQTHSWSEVKKELDKCVLLCSNCHMEVHAGVATVGSYHNGNDTGP